MNRWQVQMLLFDIGSQNFIIYRIKDFLRSRHYLKNKPNRQNLFDQSLRASLREYQQYHRLNVTDGKLNEETYAFMGDEMSLVEIDLISLHEPLLWHLLHQIPQTQQNKYPFLGKNPFPQLTGGNLKAADEALKMAVETTDPKKHTSCDEALKDFGVPSLSALVTQMTINDNVYDGRKSTVGIVPPGPNKPRPTIASHFAENKGIGAEVFDKFFTGRTGKTTFLNDYFFSPTKTTFMTQQRALILIHESVHQFGNKTDQDFGTSKDLTIKIAEKCFPALSAAKLLGDLTL